MDYLRAGIVEHDQTQSRMDGFLPGWREGGKAGVFMYSHIAAAPSKQQPSTTAAMDDNGPIVMLLL